MCYVAMAGEISLVLPIRFGQLTNHYTRIKDFFSSRKVPFVIYTDILSSQSYQMVELIAIKH